MTPRPKAIQGRFVVGCYVLLAYLFYWPTLWATRAGSEWHASRHPGFMCDWGDPGFWAGLWLISPITLPAIALMAAAYWILSPILDLVVKICW